MGGLWGALGASWELLGRLWALLGVFELLLDRSKTALGATLGEKRRPSWSWKASGLDLGSILGRPDLENHRFFLGKTNIFIKSAV